MNPLNWLHGKPLSRGRLKVSADDFIVSEDLGFSADGEGEHLLIHIAKRGCNTGFVADALARFCQIPRRDVSFAGQKDRHAVARQWFSLRLPGKTLPDFSQFALEGCQILDYARHQRKLRIGALRGNDFTVILRELSQPDALETRLQTVSEHGVLNYFGEQRFGRNNNNLHQARRWAQDGKPPRDRQQRSFALSAARSLLFNQIVSQRCATAFFNQVLEGDALQLAGRGSWFVAQAAELNSLQQRLDQRELMLTAPLPGEGDWGSQHEALAFERQCIATESALQQLLVREKVAAARRAIRLFPGQLTWRWLTQTSLELRFWLPAGSFATSVIRELINTDDDADFSE